MYFCDKTNNDYINVLQSDQNVCFYINTDQGCDYLGDFHTLHGHDGLANSPCACDEYLYASPHLLIHSSDTNKHRRIVFDGNSVLSKYIYFDCSSYPEFTDHNDDYGSGNSNERCQATGRL